MYKCTGEFVILFSGCGRFYFFFVAITAIITDSSSKICKFFILFCFVKMRSDLSELDLDLVEIGDMKQKKTASHRIITKIEKPDGHLSDEIP